MNKRLKSIYTIFILTLLWLPAFSIAARAQETPGDGKAVDGTIRDVDSLEVSKGDSVVNAPDIPGSSDDPQDAQTAKKPEASQEDGGLTSGTSPVITCGAGQKIASSAEKEKPPTTQWVSLGTFATTGYCNCELCSSGFSLTYSGTVPQARHTISADLSLFPLGTQLMIDGVVYTVEDIGSNVTGRILDIYYDNHEDAVAHGRQYKEVLIIA